jgi:hypothetical protein
MADKLIQIVERYFSRLRDEHGLGRWNGRTLILEASDSAWLDTDGTAIKYEPSPHRKQELTDAGNQHRCEDIDLKRR